MPPLQKVEVDGVGYEIKGLYFPPIKRDPLVQQTDINIDVPNGDLFYGQQRYAKACAGCHDLDFDHGMGPAMRTCYLRKSGCRKGFQHYASNMKNSQFYWTKAKLWEFLENPELMFPDTSMSFDGIQDPKTMAGIIEYLHYLRVQNRNRASSRMRRTII